MEFILSIVIFCLAIFALSLGVILGRGAPQSCNGKQNGEDCSGCKNDCENKKLTKSNV